MTRLFFPVIAALTTLAAIASPAAPPPGQPSPVSILAQARTIQVREEWSLRGLTGRLEPGADVAVQIAKPGRMRIESVPPGSLFVTDSQAQYEYRQDQRQFAQAKANPLKPWVSSQFGLTYKANLPLLLPSMDTVAGFRWTGRVSLDGRMTDLYAYPGVHDWVEGGTRPNDVVVQKLWADSKTRLPERLAVFVTRGGRTVEVQRVDFSGWKINRPLAPSSFAWAPPVDARPYMAPKRLAEGSPAPDFLAQDRDGHPVKLADYKGKVVVLDFWATWCGPCLQGMPATDALARRYGDKGVVVVAVNVWDSRAHFADWLGRNRKYGGLTFVTDPRPLGHGDSATEQYGIGAIPAQCVIGRDGRVIGYGDSSGETEKALQKALG